MVVPIDSFVNFGALPKTDDEQIQQGTGGEGGSCPCADARLCRSLSPQPAARPEVLAFRTSPQAYHTNGSAWRLWDWEKVTTVGVYTDLTNQTDDPARELLCVAHQHNARVLTWTGDVFGQRDPMAINPYVPGSGEIPTWTKHPDGFQHPAIWRAWARNLTEFVLAAGTDGVMLDFENPGMWNHSGVVSAVCALQASLHAALPGSVVASCAYPAGVMQGLPERCLDMIVHTPPNISLDTVTFLSRDIDLREQVPTEYANCAVDELDSWHRYPVGDALPYLNRSASVLTELRDEDGHQLPRHKLVMALPQFGCVFDVDPSSGARVGNHSVRRGVRSTPSLGEITSSLLPNATGAVMHDAELGAAFFHFRNASGGLQGV